MQHRRFLFDLSFDAAEAAAAEEDAGAPQAAAAADAAAQAAALAAVRAEGFAEGRARGLAEAGEAADARAADALARVADGLDRLLADAAAGEEARAAASATLAMAIVRRMLPTFARSAGFAEIEAVVADCLRRRLDEPRIVLRIGEEFFDMARSRIEPLAREAGYPGRVIILADAELAAGDCRVEWADGGTERDSARLWREIEAAIAGTLRAPAPALAADAA